MRRPMPVSRSATSAAWSMTPWVIYDGQTAIDVSRACGDYVERREVSCRSPGGDLVDEYFCGGASRPEASRTARHDEGCTYSWNTGDWRDPGAACTLAEDQSRRVSCLRDTDKAVMPDSMCQGARPDDHRQVEDFSTCTYSWDHGVWRDPGASCTNAERQTRDVTCHRDLDKVVVDGSNCSPGDRPAETQDVRDVSGCTYAWKPGAFVDPGPACTRSETQTRDVTCRRSLNDELAPDASCTSPRPATTQVVEDYATCGFTAVEPTAWTPSSTCSATATKTRTFKCQRSNDGGEIVTDALCATAKVPLTETVDEANYSTCSNGWVESGFADPGANCGDETWTQTVTCKRDLDKQVMPDASCTATKPATTSVRYDTSSCGYSAINWTAWSYGSTCSASTTRTQTATCRRSDGQDVAASECTSRGIAVSRTESGVSNYDGCSSSWKGSGYVDPGNSCGPETWTQTVSCRRDLDQALMPDASCSGAKPSATEGGHTDYSGCDYTYGAFGPYGGWASQCAASTTRTSSRTCYRSDGAVADPSLCVAKGRGQPTQTETGSNYSGCSYSWSYSGFADPGASCTAAETHTRTSWCKRDLDGAVVADGMCSGQAQQSLTMNAGADYSGCGYSAVNWTGYTPNDTCSSSATKTRTAQCRRGDGTIVSGTECTSRGIAVSETVAEPNYSTCSNSWRGSGYVDPGASCGAETWTQTVTCKRDLDNAVMPDSACTGAKPSTTEGGHTDYSGCSYSYGAWSGYSWNDTCSASATATRTRTCYRQDGAAAPSSSCTGSASESYAAENYSGCSYTPVSSQDACVNGTQTVNNSCRRVQTGQIVAASFCGLSSTSTQNCTSYSWQAGGFGGFGSCQADSRQYQYRDVYCESRNGSSVGRADDSLCGGGKPTNVNSQGCTYAGWQQSGWGAYSSSCGSAVRYMNYQCVRTSDGAVIADAECSNRYGGKPSVADSTYNTYGCGYTPTYGGFGSCQPDNQSYASMSACTRSDGQGVDLSECVNRGNPNPRTASCSYLSTRRDQRDYDGWAKGSTKMCSRINIRNWFCNGYASCNVSNVKYVTNSGAVCNVEADVTSGPYDGTRYGPVATDIPELNG